MHRQPRFGIPLAYDLINKNLTLISRLRNRAVTEAAALRERNRRRNARILKR